MKKLTLYIILLSSIYLNVNADYIEFENCSNSSYYDNSCTLCGYYNERFRSGESKKVWNWYYNEDKKEKIFSNISSGMITALNGSDITNGSFDFNTNWVPDNIGINGNKEIISFEVDNITLNSNISNRSYPIGLITYNIFSWNVNTIGTYPLTQNWQYIKGVESFSSKYSLSKSIESGGSVTKKFDISDRIDTKECYLMYGSSCGDGFIDTDYFEECDDGNIINGDGCDNTCKIETVIIGSGDCGNGIIDRPNLLGINEQCDLGAGVFPGWCDLNCRIDKSDNSFNNVLEFYPDTELLIGNGQNVFDILDNPYIINNSNTKIYIEEELCIEKNINDTFIDGNSICTSDEIGSLDILEKKEITNASFIGNISNLPFLYKYKDSNLTTSLNGFSSSSFAGNTNIRVSIPSISNIGGGNVFIKGNNFADISELSVGFSNIEESKNKNYISSSIGNQAMSSYTNIINTNDIVDNIEAKILNNLDNFNNLNSFNHSSTINTLPTEQYNGLNNIFIHKGNVELSNQNLFGDSKTYIIDSGDLIINGDIEVENTIAFVVLGGDIKISNSVKNIDATLLSIEKGGLGGKIQSNNTDTTLNQLVIGGGIYGNIDDLVLSRSFINNNNLGLVDVGVIVNYNSKYFFKSPPLISQFIGDYLNSEKISR